MSANDINTPSTTAATAVRVTQDDEYDEFAPYCLPDDVLVRALEEVEEELGLNVSDDREDAKEQLTVSLTQLVEDENEAGPNSRERQRLKTLMLLMRSHLEDFVNDQLSPTCNVRQLPRMILTQKIRQFGLLHSRFPDIREFVSSMHTIRDYGNRAAHHASTLPNREECQVAVEKYKILKASFERHVAARARGG